MHYDKQPTTIDEQIDILKNRRLQFQSEERARKYLGTIGYYRLTGYMYHMQLSDGSHNFKEGSTFERVIDTYNFDKKLRYLFASYLERIEVAMRTLLTNSYSPKYTFLWYTRDELYTKPQKLTPELEKEFEEQRRPIPRKYIDVHNYIMKCVQENYAKATENFIIKFKQKYTSEAFPPSNMAMEILTMGKIAKLFEGLKAAPEKQAVADAFKLPHVVLSSWLIYLTNIRNICAHHARLWNRRTTADRFTMPVRKSHEFSGNQPEHFNTTLYGTLSVMLRLLNAFNPENSLLNKFTKLVEAYPNVNTALMGFPADWQQNPAWEIAEKEDCKVSTGAGKS